MYVKTFVVLIIYIYINIYIYIYIFKALHNFLACLRTVFPEGTIFCDTKLNKKEVKTKSELTYK